MKAHRFLTILVAGVLSAGCTLQSELDDPAVFSLQKRNIIERNLTAPAELAFEPASVLSMPALQPVRNATADRPIIAAAVTAEQPLEAPPLTAMRSAPLLFIEFENESLELQADHGDLVAIADKVRGGGGVLHIVGFSHGPSVVGVARLATGRAQAVRNAFDDQGVPGSQMKTMASWGPDDTDDHPARGVQVFLFPPVASDSGVGPLI